MSQQNLFGEQKTTCDIICVIDKGACPEYKDCKERKNIEERLNRKYEKATKEAKEKHHIDPPKKEDIYKLAYSSWNNGFCCPYCNMGLSFNAKRGEEAVKPAVSLDHKIPISAGGTNKLENLQFICHRCNLVKTNLHPDYYYTIVKCLKNQYGIPGLENVLNTLYIPAYRGKMDNQKVEVLEAKILSLKAKLMDKSGDALV